MYKTVCKGSHHLVERLSKYRYLMLKIKFLDNQFNCQKKCGIPLPVFEAK